MLRFLLRLSGFLLLAAGFAALVIDGARWIAAGDFTPARLGVLVEGQFPALAPALRASVERDIHPLLWPWVLAPLLAAPAFVILGLLGLALLRLGRRPPEPVGFSPRR